MVLPVARLLLQADLLRQGASEFEFGHHLTRESLQRKRLLGRETVRAWRMIEHAQGPERQSVSCSQHGSGVEAQIRLTRDQRIGAEAGIEGGVRDHEQPTMLDGLGADAHVERRLAHAQADLRLENLYAK